MCCGIKGNNHRFEKHGERQVEIPGWFYSFSLFFFVILFFFVYCVVGFWF